MRGLLDAKGRLPGAVDRVVDRWWIEGGSWLPGVDRGDLNATGVGFFWWIEVRPLTPFIILKGVHRWDEAEQLQF